MARVTSDNTKEYLESFLPEENSFVLKAKAEARRWQKDQISLSAYEAHLVCFFIRQFRCVRFIELGTLAGYSALKILESLPTEGHLWTFELNSERAQFASALFDEAGYKGRYTIIVGRAEEQLATIVAEAPFDGIFIDANKSSYPFYLDWSLKHLKPGGLLLADNTLMAGVADTHSPHPEKMIRELRAFNQELFQNPGLEAVILPTLEGLAVGVKRFS